MWHGGFSPPCAPSPHHPLVSRRREGEVVLLLGFRGEQRGAELCQSHMHSDGHVEGRGCVLKSPSLIFGLLAQRGQMAGLFLPLVRTKFIWAHHCISEYTSKGVGKV